MKNMKRLICCCNAYQRKEGRYEITEYHIYKNIAKMVKNKEDKKILQKIADEELKHYNLWKSHTR